MEHIRQLRKPFRVVSTSSRNSKESGKPGIHRVECVIYPKPYKIVSENINIDEVDNYTIKTENVIDETNDKDIENDEKIYVSSIPERIISREVSCKGDNIKELVSDGFLVEDDDIITLVLNGQGDSGEEGTVGTEEEEYYVPCQEDEMMFLLPRNRTGQNRN
jgi:hypothetical protein